MSRRTRPPLPGACPVTVQFMIGRKGKCLLFRCQREHGHAPPCRFGAGEPGDRVKRRWRK